MTSLDRVVLVELVEVPGLKFIWWAFDASSNIADVWRVQPHPYLESEGASLFSLSICIIVLMELAIFSGVKGTICLGASSTRLCSKGDAPSCSIERSLGSEADDSDSDSFSCSERARKYVWSGWMLPLDPMYQGFFGAGHADRHCK